MGYKIQVELCILLPLQVFNMCAGADLLEKAAEAAHALSREAQKAVEVESKFEALRELRHFPEDVDLIKEHPVEPER